MSQIWGLTFGMEGLIFGRHTGIFEFYGIIFHIVIHVLSIFQD